MNKHNRIISIVIVVTLAICNYSCYAASQFPASGSCGPGANFTFDRTTGHLEIFPAIEGENGRIENFYFYTEDRYNIKSVNISEGITEIGSFAFQSCYDTTVISLPDSLEVIGNGAFNACKSVKEFYISKNVREIGHTAFYGNKAERVILDSENPYYTYQDGVLYTSDMTTVVAFFNEPIDICILAPTTKEIMICAGGGGPQMTKYVLPHGIEILGRSGLPTAAKNVVIPETVKKMDVCFTSGGSYSSAHFIKQDLSGIEVSGNFDYFTHDFSWQPYSYKQFTLDDDQFTISFNIQEYNPISEKRWAAREQTLEYFQNGGGVPLNEDIALTAPCDSVITLYSRDIGNNETVTTFDLSEVVFPDAEDLVFGQQLKNCAISGGSSAIQGVSGTWKWSYSIITPDPGSTFQTVRFVSSATSILPSFEAQIPVYTRLPEISESEYPSYDNTLIYGQPLVEANLQQTGNIGGLDGTWTWENPSLILNVGAHTVNAVFKPLNADDISEIIELEITVEKATPILKIPTELSITYGQSLGDITFST